MAPALEKVLPIHIKHEVNVPTWLKEELFKDLLKSEFPNYDKILQFSVKVADHGMDNLALLMRVLRIQIQVQLKDGKTKTVSFILNSKNPPAEKLDLELRDFQREITLFDEILPAFEALYKEVGKELKVSPQSYKIKPKIGEQFVLVEDLHAKGYRRVQHFEGLCMKQTQAVLAKLAAFHAASAVYYEKNRGLPSIYMKPLLGKQQVPGYEKLTEAANRKFHENLRLYGVREYQDFIKSYQKHIDSVYSRQYDPNEFNVLLHGNLWYENIFFQADAFGRLKDTIFVDFQASHYGSPAKDLFYFLLSSTRLTEKLKHFDYCIKSYHDQLVDNLKLLKYSKPLPTLTDLQLALLKHSSWAFITISRVLPITLLEPNPAIFVNLQNEIRYNYETFILDLLYNNQGYGEQISEILPWLENRSFLEE